MMHRWLILFLFPLIHARRRPLVRLYILAGDDNIEGYASVPHLHELAQQPSHPYEHLWRNNSWTVRHDVYVSYDHFHKDDEFVHGPLSITGRFGASVNCFGPEIQLGHVLGSAYEEPVVLVKAGWKGRKLTTDFASPSSGVAGFQWFRMMNAIKETAKQLDVILGDKKYKRSKLEIGGVVWWQGYADLEARAKEHIYAAHLENFVRDVRSELKRPNLPFLVVELGGRGMIPNHSVESSFRVMQQSVVKENFDVKTTKYVPTASYVQQDVGDLPIVYPDGDSEHPYKIYYAHAGTMLQISQAIGMALLSMDPKKRNSKWSLRDSTSLPEVYETNALTNLVLICGVGIAVFALVHRLMGSDDTDDDSTGHSPRRGWLSIRERFRPRDYDIPKEIELDFTKSELYT